MLLLAQHELDDMRDAAYRRGVAEAVRLADDLCFPTTERHRPSKDLRAASDPDETLAILRAAAGRVERQRSHSGSFVSLRELLGVPSAR